MGREQPETNVDGELLEPPINFFEMIISTSQKKGTNGVINGEPSRISIGNFESKLPILIRCHRIQPYRYTAYSLTKVNLSPQKSLMGIKRQQGHITMLIIMIFLPLPYTGMNAWCCLVPKHLLDCDTNRVCPYGLSIRHRESHLGCHSCG